MAAILKSKIVRHLGFLTDSAFGHKYEFIVHRNRGLATNFIPKSCLEAEILLKMYSYSGHFEIQDGGHIKCMKFWKQVFLHSYTSIQCI